MAGPQQRIDALQATVGVLQTALTDATQEIVNMKAMIQDLHDRSGTAWTRIDARIGAIEVEVTEIRGQDRRAGNTGDKWNLDHKGALKDFDGDKKKYKLWAKRVKALCYSKQAGFRKVLKWPRRFGTS